MELMQANRQWSSRAPDERFTSMTALAAFCRYQRSNSTRRTVANRSLTVIPSADGDDLALDVVYKNGGVEDKHFVLDGGFTHWSFQQLCSLSGVPAGYIRDSGMPPALACDNLNWGLKVARQVEDVSLLMRRNGGITLAAVNGPNYGTIWNATISDQLVEHFGDGVKGDWRIPGEFSHHVEPTKENTTLYASDRDMWVFLADEDRRIELPDRRNGETGSLARGFYISNSEVGAGKARFGTFMFDYVCCNRIIWGARDFDEVAIRHTKGAPHRWLEEVAPVLKTLATSSPEPIRDSIQRAREHKLGDKVQDFLATRFGSRSVAKAIAVAHQSAEQRPIETVWDVVTGATEYAKLIPFQDERVKVERIAGDLLKLAA